MSSNENTRLKTLFGEDLDKNNNSLFYDRDPKHFSLILNHLRGYTIILPENENDLYMIYEDTKYYKIKTLETIIEKLLLQKNTKKSILNETKNEKLISFNHSSDEFVRNITKPEIINFIKKKIYELKLDNLKNLIPQIENASDHDVLLLRSKIMQHEKNLVNNNLEESIFNATILILRWIETKFPNTSSGNSLNTTSGGENTQGSKSISFRFAEKSNIAKELIKQLLHENTNTHIFRYLIFCINIIFNKNI
jgi:hypothetical protein